MMKINRILRWLTLCLGAVLWEACTESKHPAGVLDLFPEPVSLDRKVDAFVPEDSLAVVEGLVCEGKNLVVYDFCMETSYTLFDACSGEYITRFGRIGQGPGEILAGCYGSLVGGHFTVFSNQSHVVMDYDLDSLRVRGEAYVPVRLIRYDLEGAQLSRLSHLGAGRFLGAGVYQPGLQYVLFDKNNQVLDAAVDVYNAADPAFNQYTKYLSNQGDLATHPDGCRLAYSLNFSSNIDFLEVKDGSIRLLNSLRLGNPAYQPETSSDGRMNSANLTSHSVWGYINICATRNYVYALYTEKAIGESGRRSSTVLVYDWQGEPVKRYSLDAEVYAIAVDSEDRRLFASLKDADGDWNIALYEL